MDTYYTEDQLPSIAEDLVVNTEPFDGGATILGLIGDLGTGKTSLVKSIAKELGVKDVVVSPTFVVAKFYETNNKKWDKLIHVDAYRIEDPKELDQLNWDEIVRQPKSLIIVEWPELINSRLPDNIQIFNITHENNGRRIKK